MQIVHLSFRIIVCLTFTCLLCLQYFLHYLRIFTRISAHDSRWKFIVGRKLIRCDSGYKFMAKGHKKPYPLVYLRFTAESLLNRFIFLIVCCWLFVVCKSSKISAAFYLYAVYLYDALSLGPIFTSPYILKHFEDYWKTFDYGKMLISLLSFCQ